MATGDIRLYAEPFLLLFFRSGKFAISASAQNSASPSLSIFVRRFTGPGPNVVLPQNDEWWEV